MHYCQIQHNFESDKNLRKLSKEYLSTSFILFKISKFLFPTKYSA